MSITTAPTSAKTAKPTTANTNTNAAENTTASKQYLKLAGLILGLSTILLLMLLSFITPLLNSGAKDLPLAVGGPDMVTTKITQVLEAKSPDAFAVTSYSTAEEATEAVRNREAIGAITAGPDGITIVTASAAGNPFSTILKQIGEGLSQTGQPIHYTDVAPLTAKDPSGSAISMLALPMIFGGMSSAVAFSTVFKKSRRKQIIGAIGVAILGGLIASATLYFGFGAFEANFWPTTTVIMLGIAAISLTVLGLNSLLGFAGIGLGANAGQAHGQPARGGVDVGSGVFAGQQLARGQPRADALGEAVSQPGEGVRRQLFGQQLDQQGGVVRGLVHGRAPSLAWSSAVIIGKPSRSRDS